jgi:hypothetical protein
VRAVRAHTFLAVDRRQAVARSPLPALTTERQDTSSSAMKPGFARASTPPERTIVHVRNGSYFGVMPLADFAMSTLANGLSGRWYFTAKAE